VFPADDVGSRTLFSVADTQGATGYDAVYRVLQRWRPYRGLLYFCLLLDHMAEAGTLQTSPTMDDGPLEWYSRRPNIRLMIAFVFPITRSVASAM